MSKYHHSKQYKSDEEKSPSPSNNRSFKKPFRSKPLNKSNQQKQTLEDYIEELTKKHEQEHNKLKPHYNESDEKVEKEMP